MANTVSLVSTPVTVDTGGVGAASLTIPAPAGLASTDLQVLQIAIRYPQTFPVPDDFASVNATVTNTDNTVTSYTLLSRITGTTDIGAGGPLGDIVITPDGGSSATMVATRFALRSTSGEYEAVNGAGYLNESPGTYYEMPPLLTSGIPEGSFVFGNIGAKIGSFSGGASPPSGATMLTESTADIVYIGTVEQPWVDADILTSGTIQSGGVYSHSQGIYDPGGTAEVAAGGRAAKIATSVHGTIGWTQRPSTFGGSNVIIRLSYSLDLGMWIAGGYDRYATSPDAVTWTSRAFPLPAGHGIWAAEWSPELGLFVIAGDDGKLYTSTDGISYTSRTSGLAGQIITDCVWSPGLGLFVVVGDGGGLATSPDGITWTTRTSSFSGSAIHAVTWSPDLGLFVAAGAGSKVGTSTNGTSWTVATTGVTTARTAVWSPDAAVFVIAGDSGALKSSPDGTSWTTRTSQFGTTRIMGSTWAGTVGVSGVSGTLIIVGNTGKMSTSTDGITWAARTSSFGTTEIYDVHAKPGAPVPPTPTRRPVVGYIGPGLLA